jgi:hypothetical protein
MNESICRQLSDIITSKKEISVDKTEGGNYSIVIRDNSRISIYTIDPSRGYSLTLQENYNEDRLVDRYKVNYEEITKDIWFPAGGLREGFNPDGSINMKTTFKTSSIIINDPAFDESYFNIDLPNGIQVTDRIQGKQYIVGSQNEYDLARQDEETSEEKKETSEPVDPNSWKERFYEVYSLQDNEVLKRIKLPFIPERRNYHLNRPRPPSSVDDYNYVSQFVFYWGDELSLRRMSTGTRTLIRRLNRILHPVIGLGNVDYEIPNELLNIDMSGDWIVREGTSKEMLLRSLEKIIKEETGREIEFVKEQVQADVIIVRGQYSFESLPGVKDGNYVLLSTNKTDTYIGGGSRSGTIEKFLRQLSDRVNMKIINETESQGIKIRWRNHDSSSFRQLEYNGQQYNEQLDLLLKNLAFQTGLTFERTKAEVEKWFVAEAGVLQTSRQIDKPAEDTK